VRGKWHGSPNLCVWFCIVRVASFESAARKRGYKTPRFRLRFKRGNPPAPSAPGLSVVALAKSEGRAPPPIQFIWFAQLQAPLVSSSHLSPRAGIRMSEVNGAKIRPEGKWGLASSRATGSGDAHAAAGASEELISFRSALAGARFMATGAEWHLIGGESRQQCAPRVTAIPAHAQRAFGPSL